MDEYNSDSVYDEYDREVMERVECGEEVEDVIDAMPIQTWDMPMFRNIDAWYENQPSDEYVGGSMNTSRDPDNEIYLGRTFPDKNEAIYTVQKYSIQNRVEYRVKESEPSFMVLECRNGNNDCQWRIRVACKKNRTYWEVTKYAGDHVCQNLTLMQDNVHLSAGFIAIEVKGILSAKLRVCAAEIKARIKKDYGYDISYLKAWQAKHKALDLVFGTWEESFNHLPQLMTRLEQKNPGSVVILDRTFVPEEGKCVVNRVFWAFGPSIEAYPHCRPLLSIDGTHLYGRYNGKLLVACALDANNHVLPLAFALVESENISSWKWFMRCIRQSVTDRDGICVLSDRHNGILAAMREPEWRPPRAYHRYCVRHFVSNFSTKVRDGSLKAKLSLCAYQRQKCKFDIQFQELVALLHSKPEVRDWLVSHDPKMWSLAYDEGGVRYGSMTTNASECFNKVLLGGRDLPICALVRFTFDQTSAWFVERIDKYQDGHLFAPKIEARMERLIERAHYHHVRMFNRAIGLFEVITTRKHHKLTVNLSEQSCSCGKWTLFKYPCSHVLAVCKHQRIAPEEYVDPYFRIDSYIQTWSPYFIPLGDERYPHSLEGPLHIPAAGYKRTTKGRPPTNRRHNEMDQSQPRSSQHEASTSQAAGSSQPRVSRVQHCRICGVLGHNRRSCPSRPQE